MSLLFYNPDSSLFFGSLTTLLLFAVDSEKGALYVYGGTCHASDSKDVHSGMFKWDIETETWTKLLQVGLHLPNIQRKPFSNHFLSILIEIVLVVNQSKG